MASILASPRKKQRITPNPRGNNWSKDANKFGQRLLEKMGWSQGKGLGVSEDGVTDHVRVTRKDNATGVGFTGCPDTWTAHHDDFNSILLSLNASNVASGETKSASSVMNLAEKSKKSRSRLHYGKFTKSKDLSTKSVSDLDCVFGRRNHVQLTQHQPSHAHTKNEVCEVQEDNRRFVRSNKSMSEYFAEKLKKASRPIRSFTDKDNVVDKVDANCDDEILDEKEDCLKDKLDVEMAENEETVGDTVIDCAKVRSLVDENGDTKDCWNLSGVRAVDSGEDDTVGNSPSGDIHKVKNKRKKSKKNRSKSEESKLVNGNMESIEEVSCSNETQGDYCVDANAVGINRKGGKLSRGDEVLVGIRDEGRDISNNGGEIRDTLDSCAGKTKRKSKKRKV